MQREPALQKKTTYQKKKKTKTKIKSRCTAYSNHRAKHKETNQLSTQKKKHKAKQSKAREYIQQLFRNVKIRKKENKQNKL